MQAIQAPVTEFIRQRGQFIVPVFQRDYTWTAERECSQLWNDLIFAASLPEKSCHFLGSIVHKKVGGGVTLPQYLIIDGQQRLATLTLLLIAVRDHIAKTGATPEALPSVPELDDYYLLNTHKSGRSRYRMLLRRQDAEALIRLVDGHDEPDGSELVSRNYEWFRARVETADLDELWHGLSRLVIVDVSLHDDDDAQSIYESLNATGIRLRVSDLVRNYLLMNLPLDRQTALYETHWSEVEDLFRGNLDDFDRFVRDWLDLRTRAASRTPRTEVYSRFQHHWRDRRHANLAVELDDIRKAARSNAAFRFGTNAPQVHREHYSFIRAAARVAPAITVMRLHESLRRHDGISERAYQEALMLIESFLMRRAVCGEPTNSYEKAFCWLSSKLRDDNALIDLKTSFQRRPWGYHFPSDAEFEGALLENPLAKNRFIKTLLERLETHRNRARPDTSRYTVEHILPQNPQPRRGWSGISPERFPEVQEQWVHRLGNLTLTAYNSRYSDHPFEEKKTMARGFVESALSINRYVNEQTVWTEVEIEERTRLLAARALKVWPALDVDGALVERAEFRDLCSGPHARTKILASPGVRVLFERYRSAICGVGSDIVELTDGKAASYHRDGRYFAEIVPRTHDLGVLLRLDRDRAEKTAPHWVWDSSKIQHARYVQRMPTRFWHFPHEEESEFAIALRLIAMAYSSLD